MAINPAEVQWDDAPIVWDDEKKPQQMTKAGQVMAGALPMFGGAYAGDLMMGLRQPLDAAAQAAARLTGWGVKDTEGANQQAMDAYRQNFAPDARPGSDFVRGAGQALGTAPVTPAMAAGGVIKGAAQGAGMGGAMGALTPVYGAGSNPDFWKQKQDQAAMGAAGGAMFGAGGAALGKVLAPKVNPQAQQLLDEGVTPTPGQIMGGLAKSLEEKARSVPLLGEAITAGQRRGIEEYNRSLYAKALAPIGKKAEAKTLPVGNDGIAAVGDKLSAAYEDALSRSVPAKVDAAFKARMSSLEAKVPQAIRQDFIDIIDAEVRSKVTPRQMLIPSVVKEIDSVLGAEAAGYRGSSVQAERKLGEALRQAQAELRSLMAKYNPVTGPELRAVDKGWANLVQLENAGAMLGAKEGIFTPAQFLNAVKKSDKSPRDRQFARGNARNQGIAQAADAVLSQKYPDSGTAGRAMLGAVGAGGLGLISPYIPAAGAVGALAYTPIGQRASAALLTQRPAAVRTAGDWLKDLAPYLSGPGAAGLLGL
jgi:hypothetical protein